NSFLLAEPTSWVLINDNKVPVYSNTAQRVTHEADIGIKLFGDPLPGNHYNLLYGPVTWIPVPGSSRSNSRIPGYSTGSPTVQDGIGVAAQAVGKTRMILLSNPKGFMPLSGSWVPYW